MPTALFLLRRAFADRMVQGVRRLRISVLVLALGCAPARKIAGELAVRPAQSLFPASQLIVQDSVFRLEEARIVATGAAAGVLLDLVAMDDGCLRGQQGLAQVHICPNQPEPGDKKGLVRWHSSGGSLVSYATQLISMGDKLRLESGLAIAELNLPEGAAGDEARQHPELIAAAWALGLFPSSAVDDQGVHIFRVTSR